MTIKRKRNRLFSMAILSVLAFSIFVPSLCIADVMIMPIRTVFSDRERMKSITLVNNAPTYAKFGLSFFYQRQNADGSYVKQNTPVNPAADIAKMIIFSPREVNLPPNGRMAVRLSLRNASSLPDGEYRVHMKLKRLQEKTRREDPPETPAKGATTNIVMNIGFAVPIIVRKGPSDAKAKIVDMQYVPRGPNDKASLVSFKIERKGNYSTLGKVQLYFSKKGKSEKLISEANNINIFAETAFRQFTMSMNDENTSGGRIRVVYVGEDADSGTVFDEKTINVP